MIKFRLIIIIIVILSVILPLTTGHVAAQEEVLAPVTGLEVRDTPDDEGNSITITWKLSPDDDRIVRYEIWRSSPGDNNFGDKPVAQRPARTTEYVDESGLVRGNSYYYRIKDFKFKGAG